MFRRQKILLASSLFLFVLLGVGLFANYLLNNMITALNAPKIDNNLLIPSDSTTNEETSNSTSNVIDNTQETASGPTDYFLTKPINSDNQDINNHDIVQEVQKKIDKPIEKKDLINAAKIILENLSLEEINYLYKIGKKDTYTKEEYQKAREILITNLSDKDIEVLCSLGRKYGKTLKILDPNSEI